MKFQPFNGLDETAPGRSGIARLYSFLLMSIMANAACFSLLPQLHSRFCSPARNNKKLKQVAFLPYSFSAPNLEHYQLS